MNRVDVVVVGSGAAGLSAAAVAASRGRRVLLLEQSTLVGGTTAISGGMVWIPANHKMQAAGLADTLDAARNYLGCVVPPGGPADMLETFLARGDEAVRYLESHTALRLQPVVRYPDYYPELPGATAGGRVLEPVTFDASVLGDAFPLLRPPLPEFTLFGGMMIARADIPHLRRAARSPRSAWHVARLLARHARERLHAARGTTLVLGNALAARLFKSVLDLGVQVRTETVVRHIVLHEGTVEGVEVSSPRGPEFIAASSVVLATGGISHAPELRARFVPELAGTLSATMGSPLVPSGAALALQAGGHLSESPTQQALWVPASTFQRADGTRGVYPHTVADRAKPGLIAVDRQGRRFTNEAASYHEFVRAQLRAGAEAVPAWLVCDRDFLWRYGLGRVKPFALSVARDVASGYLRRAANLPGLAQQLGIDAARFVRTVEAFNEGAKLGIDRQFGRGGDIYQRHLGDGDHQPNPCVAPLRRPPFYAVAVQPADLGMAAGLVTDAQARVLRDDGIPIPGLLACGNDMQSVMNGAYPGPGITLGPALVFGYLAGLQAA
ncbi:FAD-dependent oxidoreductase [Ramlibacter sp. G-1-2-2]|uniref:FAD-dependent oxidoreductase n=1 Tax=Ramlibacter agri TaxID=2728837 RepID=A0A848GZU7_9BURK|nr:FAD-dependent oxidoreductase [Ramlibacter agri]NML42819.1 FAD-dependent oxidoreductase [Ramlibacter agri]